MKIFNEDGMCLGEFTEFVEECSEDITETASGVYSAAHDSVSGAFDISIFLGIIGLIVAPFWTIAAFVIIMFFKFMFRVIKLSIKLVFVAAISLLRCVWWLIKLPFSLIFDGTCPEF